MTKNTVSKCLCALLAAGLLAGCKRSSPTPGHQPADYFQTHFQDESQFVVETIVTDLAEQIYFAKFHRLPEPGGFHVTATETPESPFGAPIYDLLVDLDAGHRGLKTKLDISGPIWSPEIYGAVTAWLAQSIGLAGGAEKAAGETRLLARLADADAMTVAETDQELSTALERDFTDASLHEQAALVLGAFMLREHSGDFFEIRSPLCRLTAHLALARHLRGGEAGGSNEQMAGAMLWTLMNNQAAALEKLGGIKTNSPALASWVRALTVRNTGDYRPLAGPEAASPIENIEWFCAFKLAANADIGWGRLSEEQKKDINFVRVASQGGYSVGMGHELLALALSLELQEVAATYRQTHAQALNQSSLVAALNEMPGRCLARDRQGAVQVHVIGWGMWAGFLQRQLCHAVQHNFNFLQNRWGVPDEAKKFSAKADALFGGLRLYPFVQRFNCLDVAAYHQSVDAGLKVTTSTPQLVPAECWNNLCYQFSPEEHYPPAENAHVSEWHKHNPPPGTAYDLYPRLNHLSLVGRGDAAKWLDELHVRAPFDWNLNYYLLRNRFNNTPTYDEAVALFGASAAYNTLAMGWLARAVKDQPEKYEAVMLRSAAVDPRDYFALGDFFAARKEDDKAAGYYEKGGAASPDTIEMASHAKWLVHHYLARGKTQEARRVADFAGEVYSHDGLEAKAAFLEATKDYAGAFQWYSNIEERYEKSGPLIAFCLRYKAKTGDTRFDAEVKERTGKLFPSGFEQVTLASFSAAPADGVVLKENSELTRAAGVKASDVIVAIYGVRVHNVSQYEFKRDGSTDPELDLIVWQGGGYRVVKASPSNHLFGVDIGDYQKR
jgi:tetratricopeptide (TPR) repeat protein